MVATLVDVSSGQTRRFDLGPHTTLGRDPANSIAFADPSVSSRHAEIVRTTNGTYQLVNLSSTNGTFVGGARVTALVLSHGDEIAIGVTRLRFEAPVAPAPDTLRAVDLGSVQIVGPHEPTVPFHADADASTTTFRPHAELTDEAALRRDYEKLRAAHQLNRAIGGEDNLEVILDRIADTALELFSPDRIVILLVDPDSGQAVPRVARARDAEQNQKLSTSILEHVIASKKAVLCTDIENDTRFNKRQSVVIQGIRSAMCVPILHENQLLGVIHLDSKMSSKVFHASDLEVFCTIAGNAGAAVKAALLKRQLRELERQRAEATRELIAGASHFINNPLSVIRSSLSLLVTWSGDIGTYHQAAEAIPALADLRDRHGIEFIDAELSSMCRDSLNAAHRIGAIVDALRIFQAEPERTEPVAITGPIEQAIADAAALASDRAEIRTSLPPTRVAVPHARLVQLFSALITNACQAIDPGRRGDNHIGVVAQEYGTNVFITVEDTGRGVPADSANKIFVPFYTSREDRSLGLGLAIAAEIVRQYEGSIRVRARDGGGTQFVVHLPIAA